MDKKELKLYETPACEVEELELEGMLCVSVEGLEEEDDVTGGNKDFWG